MQEPESEGDERRDRDRVPVRLKVDYKRLNTFFADYTKNLSRGGTFIRTNQPLAIGRRFTFVLTVPESDAPGADPLQMELSGEVKWVVRDDEATAERPAGMGIHFVFADDDERRRIEGLVEKLMRASLGDHLAERLLARR